MRFAHIDQDAGFLLDGSHELVVIDLRYVRSRQECWLHVSDPSLVVRY
jgi:hypothetical protein